MLPNTIKKIRYSIIGSILFIMLYIMGIWFDEYHNIFRNKNFLSEQIIELRNSIYQEANSYKEAVERHDRMVLEREELERRLSQVQREQIPRQGTPSIIERPAAAPPQLPLSPPKVEDTNLPSKIQLLGLLEIELSEKTSWNTILKMIVTLLVSFFGIKSINLLFKRWELNS